MRLSCSGRGMIADRFLRGACRKFSAPTGCCPSVIMSPFVLDRNVPLIGLPRGGQIGANADEQEGVGTSGSAGWSAQQATAGRGCQWTAAGELPAGQAAVEAVSGGRSC